MHLSSLVSLFLFLSRSLLLLSLYLLASLLTSLAVILPRVMCAYEQMHCLSNIQYIVRIRPQRDAPTYTKLKWLFYRICLFILRTQSDALTYAKLEWLFYRIFCSHSAHSVTLRRILQLPTSVGLVQARPN